MLGTGIPKSRVVLSIISFPDLSWKCTKIYLGFIYLLNEAILPVVGDVVFSFHVIYL